MADGIKPSRTEHFYLKISKLVYLLGGPNYWHKELHVPEFIKKIHDPLSKTLDILTYIFIMLEWGAFFTQKNLNEKQKADLVLFCGAQPVLYSFAPLFARKKEKVREVSYMLAVKLKEYYNDEEVENDMAKRGKIFLTFFVFVGFYSALIFYGIDGVFQVVYKGSNFVTVMTVWPDIDDPSIGAGIARVAGYIMWWIYVIRMSSFYIFVIPLTICASHQYRNLYSYFCSLNQIFEKKISQEEKERKYEEAVKLGINLHTKTLRCIREIQEVCYVVFGGHVFANVYVIVVLLSQMLDTERGLSQTMSILMTIAAMLVITGCLMWSAGDITVEASNLSTAMFHSGWNHCQGKTAFRIRSLLVIAMCQSQRPVEFRCLGVVPFSYEWFLKIVKTSYSIFSFLF